MFFIMVVIVLTTTAFYAAKSILTQKINLLNSLIKRGESDVDAKLKQVKFSINYSNFTSEPVDIRSEFLSVSAYNKTVEAYKRLRYVYIIAMIISAVILLYILSVTPEKKSTLMPDIMDL